MVTGWIKMSKIGKKIIQSYIVVILCTALVFLIISKMSFNSILNSQTTKTLKSDADTIASQMIKQIDRQIGSDINAYNNKLSIRINSNILSENTDSPSDIVIPGGLGFSPNRLATTHIIVLDNEKNPVYQSYISNEEPININKIDPGKYFVEQRVLKPTGQDKILGYLIMMAKKEDLTVINSLINRSVILGFLISLLIATLISFFFERSIINPIYKVKKNIRSFSSLNEEISWEEIKTKDEISEINDDFLMMAKRLKEYDKSQKEFFQNTSHELKTPLMSIQGYAEAIKDGVIDNDSENEALDIIIDESKKLRDTVNSIVYLSKMEKFNNHQLIIKINLWEKLEEIKAKLSVIAQENNVVIYNRVAEDIVIKSTDEKLDKVFSNIISNALRYANSCVWISSESINKSHIKITVSDDGKGFEDNEAPKIFDRFYKGKGGNSGLGLSIVKSIADSHGWSINAFNNQDKGASIQIIIPPEKGHNL